MERTVLITLLINNQVSFYLFWYHSYHISKAFREGLRIHLEPVENRQQVTIRPQGKVSYPMLVVQSTITKYQNSGDTQD